jgi:hypothetical protein
LVFDQQFALVGRADFRIPVPYTTTVVTPTDWPTTYMDPIGRVHIVSHPIYTTRSYIW